MRHAFFHRLLPFALVLLGGARLEATSYVLVSDQSLAEQAALVVRAEILEVGASETSGPITTDYRLRVDEVVSGETPNAEIVVRMLGGELTSGPNAGRGLHVWGIPVFEPGQRVFFFLGRNPDATYHVLHLFQGAFHEVSGQGETVLVRSLDEAHQLPALDPAAIEPAGLARSAEGFAAWLRDREQGIERPRDYFVPAPPELLPGYTLIGDGVGRLFRWFEFDAGEEIVWFRHQAGQPGLSDSGAAAFAAALAVWNDEPHTAVRYVDGGTTDSVTGFNSSDRRNTILFSDLSDDISSTFSCSRGGTLAVGGVSFARTTTRPWRGRQFEPIAETEIIINDGTECYFNGRPDRATETWGHEVGHTLGLGHSCGDGNSPTCSEHPEADEALMRANVHDDRRGAVLNRDDRAGVRFLYDASFDGTVCPLPPGHPEFCRECGPCGPEEGDCDGQNQCMPTLTCTPGRGADFGFGPDTDVCLAGGTACPRPFGDRRFCRDCGPCAAGEGGCRKNSECGEGLVCEKRAGDEFGFAPNVGVCVAADPEPCSRPLGHKRYCRDCGPCRLGEGGCRGTAECGGLLVCVKDAGGEFGLPAKTDVCK